MKALKKYAFAPNAFEAAESVYGYLQSQRRGFGFFAQPEDPKIHSCIASAQRNALNHLLHPRVLQRITDATEYGNTYRLDEYMDDLTDAIFNADLQLGQYRPSATSNRIREAVDHSPLSGKEIRHGGADHGLGHVEANPTRPAKRVLTRRVDPGPPRAHTIPHRNGVGVLTRSA